MNKIIVRLIDIDSLNNGYSFYSNTHTLTTTALGFDPLTRVIRIHLREDSIARDARALDAKKIKTSKRRA
jgi:hypothetical protein